MVIDLFVEMETIVTFDWTHAQIHRASNYDDFSLVLGGTISSNSGNGVAFLPVVGHDLNNLEAVTSVYGPLGADIPLTYYYWDVVSESWVLCPALWGGWGITFEECFNEFEFLIVGNVEFHQFDGWYTTEAELCPSGGL